MALRVIGRGGSVGFRSGLAAGWCAGWGDRRRQAMTVSVSVTRPRATSCRRSDAGLPSAFGWRWSSRGSRPPPSSVRARARHPARGGLAGHHSAAVPAAVGQRGIERQTVLDLDAFGAKEKALHGNPRGHAGTHGSRASRSDNWNLRSPAPKASSATTPTPTPNRSVVLPVPAAPGSWPSTGR
jgi:hypothetical protein